MSVLKEQQILTRARSKNLESVKNLNFWGSSLTDISIIRELANVEVLSLSVNSICSLKDFAYCPRLKELYLRRNSVNDISEIGFLRKLPKLRVLWLSDNPCAASDNYRQTVLKNLPKLIRLDNVAVEDGDIVTAVEAGDDVEIPDDIPDHPDLGDTITSTMGSTRNSQAFKENSVRGSDDQRVPYVTADQPNITRMSLVDETNKLRAELGIKPLVLDEPKSCDGIKTQPSNTPSSTSPHPSDSRPSSTSPHPADSRPSSTSPHPADSRNANILSAVLSLVKELNRGSLEMVKNVVEKQLAEYNSERDEKEDSNRPMIEEIEAN